MYRAGEVELTRSEQRSGACPSPGPTILANIERLRNSLYGQSHLRNLNC